MLIFSYINTTRNWKKWKLGKIGNKRIGKLHFPPFRQLVSTQFVSFSISTRVDITVYQYEKNDETEM